MWRSPRPKLPPPMRSGLLALAGLLLTAGIQAHAQTPATTCNSSGDSRAYLDCLGDAQKTSEQQLDRAIAGARASVEARGELQAVQRQRWLALLEESQGRFVHWRNFECQSIAPYEGGGGERAVGGRLGGIGVLEQRLVCLTRMNETRTSDLDKRYKPPAGWLERYVKEMAAQASKDAALRPDIATPAGDRIGAGQTTPNASGTVRIIAP
jgi:uncharacterized protein YecT (DUF1311 family)